MIQLIFCKPRELEMMLQALIAMSCCDQNCSAMVDSNPYLLMTGRECSMPLRHPRCLIKSNVSQIVLRELATEMKP